VLSRLDRRIRAIKGWLYWSLVGTLAAVIIGALVVITTRALVGPMGPGRPRQRQDPDLAPWHRACRGSGGPARSLASHQRLCLCHPDRDADRHRQRRR
jgi:hypothetical protein